MSYEEKLKKTETIMAERYERIESIQFLWSNLSL
jgi:hypothetical protein